MRTYKQLTQEQRSQINAFLKTGQTQIAAIIRMHKSTISRELRRNPWPARLRRQAGPLESMEPTQEGCGSYPA